MAEQNQTDETAAEQSSAQPQSRDRARRGAGTEGKGQSEQSAEASIEQPDTFAVDDLIARSADFFGQPSHIVAGALHGRKEISLDDARGRIDSFLEGTASKAKEA